MDGNGGIKLLGIRQIARLKEFLNKWQSVTLGSSSCSPHSGENHGGISPVFNRRLRDLKCWDSDEESCPSPDLPLDVPKGYLAVYVGPELRRFIIPTSYLSHPVFKVLLEKAEEEFGFDISGGLTIPCEIETFKYLLKCVEHQQKDHLDDSAGMLFS